MKTLDKILKKKIGKTIYLSFDEGEDVQGKLVEVDNDHFTLKQYEWRDEVYIEEDYYYNEVKNASNVEESNSIDMFSTSDLWERDQNMHWERVCNTWQLITADGYGFYLVPDDKVDETLLYNETSYDVYIYCAMHYEKQLLSKERMPVDEAKAVVETIINKFKTLK